MDTHLLLVSLRDHYDDLGAAAALIAVIGSVLGWHRRVKPVLHEIGKDLRSARDVLIGRGPIIDPLDGSVAKPGVDGIGVRMAERESVDRKILVDIAAIRHEVEFNDGSSVKDATVRTEKKVDGLATAMLELSQAITRIDDRLQDGDQEFEEIDQRLERMESKVDRLAE